MPNAKQVKYTITKPLKYVSDSIILKKLYQVNIWYVKNQYKLI